MNRSIPFVFECEWPEFPGLHTVLQCIFSKGAMLIDVWRILILWEYGSIYTDIDN